MGLQGTIKLSPMACFKHNSMFFSAENSLIAAITGKVALNRGKQREFAVLSGFRPRFYRPIVVEFYCQLPKQGGLLDPLQPVNGEALRR